MFTTNKLSSVLQRNMLQAALLLAALFLIPALSQAQYLPKAKVGKGLRYIAADSSFAVKMNVRFQTLYEGVYEYPVDNIINGEIIKRNEDFTDGFLIRRARLKFEGYVVSPKLEYKVELGLSNRDTSPGSDDDASQFRNTSNIILDAVLAWEFAPNWTVMFGQTKLPGNRERVISSQKLQFVDRSLLNAAYNIDRDAGIQLRNTFAVGQVIFREAAAISLGEGRNFARDNRGGYNYTGRVEVLPFGEFEGEGDYFGSDLAREETPKLAVGVTYDYNDRASREGGQLGDFLSKERTLTTFFADAMFKYQGLSIMSEYADKRTEGSPVVSYEDDGAVNEAFEVGTGFLIQAGYLFRNNFEVAARYTTIDAARLIERPDQKEYTLGVSKYIAGHTVKVQSDVSLLRSDGYNDELVYRFQVEMGF